MEAVMTVPENQQLEYLNRMFYKMVVDELRVVSFKRRTKLVTGADGVSQGKGYYCRPPRVVQTKRVTTSRGDCITLNHTLWRQICAKKGSSENVRLMYGELLSRLNEWAFVNECKGMPIFHVWVEVLTADGWKVYDSSDGLTIADQDLYYFNKRVKRTEVCNAPEILLIPGSSAMVTMYAFADRIQKKAGISFVKNTV